MTLEPSTVEYESALAERVGRFYARQVRLLDNGHAEQWADTFTTDGVFEEVGKPEPLRGRDAIAVSARARVDQNRAEGVRRRHWFGMLDVVAQPDGTVLASYYALVMATPRGGPLNVYVSAEANDILVPTGDGGWLVRHRIIRHDAA